MSKLYEKIRGLVIKNKGVLLYLFFGGATTLVNFVVYYACKDVLHIIPEASNVAAWCVAVCVAFATNKLFVFESRSFDGKTLAKESASFFLARLATLGMDQGLFITLHTWLGINDFMVKVFINIFVIAANYFLSLFIIFRKKRP